MRVVLTGRNTDITPWLRRVVDRKLDRLSRILGDGLVSVQVVLTVEKYRRIAEIIAHVRGDHMFHGLGYAPTWQPAIGDAVAKIDTQARKLKDRWAERKRRSTGKRAISPAAPSRPPAPAPAAVPVSSPAPRILEITRYQPRLMTVDEAMAHVNGGGETIIVFRNSVTEVLSVLHRREDGHFRLIEPEA
jgi:putative sigma-54 modulation protein